MTILELARLTENEARDYMEKLRWPNGPVCPHCQGADCTRLEGKAHRPGTLQCNAGACRKQFTVTVGSVMERSRVSLVKWVMAFHLLCSSKKGFSALQLQRELGLGSYKTAWFMLHRIRHAMADHPQAGEMTGVVEADETYVGGKPRGGALPGQGGRGTVKTPVVVLVERGGKARSMPVSRCDSKTLHANIRHTVAPQAMIVTDEWRGYRGVGKHFEGGHQTVKHSHKQYARRDRRTGMSINTNTAESYFSLLKRGFIGIYHNMGKQHLHRYCAEYDFRWNHRKVSDFVRMNAAISQSAGKRLLYQGR